MINEYNDREYYEDLFLQILFLYKSNEINNNLIKPNYLSIKTNQHLLKLAIDFNSKHEKFNVAEFMNTLDKNYYDKMISLVVDDYVIKNIIDDQYLFVRKKILDYYKQNITEHLIKRLHNKNIDYEKFYDLINKLSKIKIEDNKIKIGEK